MSGIVLTPRARADLAAIWAFTADRWNIEQADRYVTLLNSAMRTVAAEPRRFQNASFSWSEVTAAARRIDGGAFVVSQATDDRAPRFDFPGEVGEFLLVLGRQDATRSRMVFTAGLMSAL